ncbi:glycerophosphodiester phosphodiesterase family protein [Alphaproteobacteria bacterium]|nr:glycerophosphodiester phosphodiesterase family protein [Alphaproteobacteria bacterium]
MVEVKLSFQLRKLRLSSKFILPKLIGHRGVKNLKPENTLESIITAFDLGLECVEIDVKISKDNIPLLLHDDTLDRTTNGSGLACDFTFHQINQLDAGYYFYNSKTDIKVPSLSAVLDLIKKKQKYLNIELKPNKNHEESNVKSILKEINIISYDRIYFSSFDLASCVILKKNAPYLQCGFLNDDFTKLNIDETIEICKKYNFISCGINLNFFSIPIVNQFIENEIQVTVYANNNISEVQAQNLWSNKVASIFIDDPTEYI